MAVNSGTGIWLGAIVWLKFLTDLAVKHDFSASTQNQVFNAAVFFYAPVLGQPYQNGEGGRAVPSTACSLFFKWF